MKLMARVQNLRDLTRRKDPRIFKFLLGASEDILFAL